MPTPKTVTFDQQLKLALKHFADPDRLTTESALATAYFLSGSPQAEVTTESNGFHWGALLRTALLAAADSMWGDRAPHSREEIEAVWDEIVSAPGDTRYDYLVLELRYFQRYFQPRSMQQIWQEFLLQSRAEFYRDIDRAVARLGEALLRYLRPGARLEALPAADHLIGRAELLGRARQALAEGKSIALSGPSGAGKTSLAAAISAEWPSGAIFWFTVRPELADRLYHLLFALGSFMHRHGADLLWRALAASQGKIDDPALMLNLAVSDLAALADQQILLIFDEVDLWQDLDESNRAIHEFVVGLKKHAPILLVGQRVDIGVDLHASVADFSIDEAHTLLTRNKLKMEAADLQKLYDATGGNPRLLWLSIDLLKQGETLAEILHAEAGSRLRPFTGFLNLLWQRLDEDERRLLHALAAFAMPAPQDPWPTATLTRLSSRHLIHYDTHGGVSLLPSVRTALLNALSAEQREEAHRQAAAIYATRAEYTLAAFHYQHAEAPTQAVDVWFPHREAEIGRGQAATAAAIFRNVSGDRLNKKTRRTLQVIRAQLYQLSGEYQAGLDALSEMDRLDEAPDELTLDARRLQGDFYDSLGQADAALHSYDQGLTTTARLLGQTVDFHALRGMVYLRQRQLADAQTAAQRARFQAEQLQGLVAAEQGDLTDAEAHYVQAIALGEALLDERGLAECNRSLSNIYGRRGELDVALDHANVAIDYYRRIGDLVKVALMRSNMAATFLDAGRFADVLTVGEPALDFYQQIGHPHGLAATACNLAEAHFELERHTDAEYYAQLAIRQEEAVALPYAMYTLALVRHAAGNVENALELLDQGRAQAQQNSDIFIEAYAWLKTAELLPSNLESRNEAAQHAVRLFTRLGIDDMAKAAQAMTNPAA